MSNGKKNISNDKTIVLVGTYRAAQLKKWITAKGYYNYPISEDDDLPVSYYKKIKELWLYSGKQDELVFSAEFIGIKTPEELKEYGYPSTKKPHGKQYLLFKVEKLDYKSPVDSNLCVVVRTKDFSTSPRIAKNLRDYLNSKNRAEGSVAARLPDSITALPVKNLYVCETAIQLDFLNLLFDEVEVCSVEKSSRKSSVIKPPKISVPSKRTVKFIDLFAGMGGIRLGFEQAFNNAGYETECVLTSEIKESAVITYKKNFGEHNFVGDVTQVASETIPDFDFLLAGFPCQAFSVAGKQRGFADTRGTLFFEVERILRDKSPYGFVLENVEGLVTHDKDNVNDAIGRTLRTILHSLDELGYHVTWKVLDAQDFGLAQVRTRIYIVGTKKEKISLEAFEVKKAVFGDIMQKGLPTVESDFSNKIFKHYKPEELYGKSIKDKRGGKNNIHSWQIGLRGEVTETECRFLNVLLKERRKHHWAEKIGIDWMDGMPLTVDQIRTFFDVPGLEEMLVRLTQLGYLVFECPKKRVAVTTGRHTVYERVPDTTKPKGYNIVTGKLSFQFSRILDPESTTPTLVAMDVSTLGVIDGKGIRNLTLREGLRLCGYPESYSLIHFSETKRGIDLGFDLLGNTVCVPVIAAICGRLEYSFSKNGEV